MPNARADGQVFTAFWAPAELIESARTVAEIEKSNLSAVIRDALTRYVEDR